MRRTSICLLKDCLKVKSELKAAFCVDCGQRFNRESWMSENSPAGGTVARYGMTSRPVSADMKALALPYYLPVIQRKPWACLI
jgi:NMD protein affecting ribosome stability and mRNA decay